MHLRLLKRPRIAVLWLATTFSVIGDRMYALAVWWLVWDATGSAALLGVVAVVESVPYIAVGMWGRKVHARLASFRALAAVDVARLGAVVVLPLLWSGGDSADVATLLVVAALLGVGGALFDPPLGSLVPELVERDDVGDAVALMDLPGRIARIAGPGLAGVLLAAVSPVTLYWIDAGTFAFSAVALLLLAVVARTAGAGAPAPPEPAAEVPRARPLFAANPEITVAVAVHTAGLFFASAAAVGMPILIAVRVDAGPSAYATVALCTGVGALVGNLATRRLPNPTADRWLRTYCTAWAVDGLLLAGMGLATTLPVLLVIAVLAGFVTPFLGVTLQRRFAGFPQPERLCLIAADQSAIRTGGIAGMLTVPIAVGAAPSAAFVVAGAATALIAVAGLPTARTLSRRRMLVVAEAG